MPRGERVALHAPDPRWSRAAAYWTGRLRSVLTSRDVVIDHVGSTAVPGLTAKPVIDLQVQVPDLNDEPTFRPALESLGLVLRARSVELCFFRPPAERPRDVHVHICEFGSRWARDHLMFRDALRADDGLAREYGSLKQRLARSFGNDRAAYNSGKSKFIARVLARNPL